MSLASRVRTDVRALASAIAFGSLLGFCIGAAYIAGLSARTANPPMSVRIALRPTVQAPSSPAAILDTPTTQIATVAPRPSATPRPALRLGAPIRSPFRLAAFEGHRERAADCLARAVYFEARGETASGQEAVAQVVLNRLRSPAFPKSVCSVVYQRSASGCQFTFACSTPAGPPVERDAWLRARQIAERTLSGQGTAIVGDATQFHAARSGDGRPRTDMAAGLMKVAQIGAHVFYRLTGGGGPHTLAHTQPHGVATPAASAPPDLRPAMASFEPLLTMLAPPKLSLDAEPSSKVSIPTDIAATRTITQMSAVTADPRAGPDRRIAQSQVFAATQDRC